MSRHGQICQSCENFTVSSHISSIKLFAVDQEGAYLINSCPKTAQLSSREISDFNKGIRETCNLGYTPKKNHDDEE